MSVAKLAKGSHSGVQKLVIALPAVIVRSVTIPFNGRACAVGVESFVPILPSSACRFSTHAVIRDELRQGPATEWRSSNNKTIELTGL